MLDCQLFGLNAGGHHLTNILLHAATAILLFWVLRQMTLAIWPSAFVAALFSIHPLRVESVAWVSERKDVLGGLFFMLTLWAYVRYVRNPRLLSGYLMVVVFFVLGLMSKPVLVTLPFVLLLLDYWPLNRFTVSDVDLAGTGLIYRLRNFSVPRRLIVEKIPLLMLSIASCIPTVLAERPAIQAMEIFPLHLRICNALVSCVTYVWQIFYPARLTIFYPYPVHGLPLWKIILAFVLLVAISMGVFCGRRKHPYLLVGWLWYLGMLVPVVGLVQVGLQAQADRHTYLPQIGLYLLLTWTLMELSASWPCRRWVLVTAATGVLAPLVVLARIQTSYWRDSESLWVHALACNADDNVAHRNLGYFLVDAGRIDDGMAHFQKALQINPDSAETYNALGYAFMQKGQVDDAIEHLQKALYLQPDDAYAHANLGTVFNQRGRLDEAIVHFQRALQIDPRLTSLHGDLGNLLLRKGRIDEAIPHLELALENRPDDATSHGNLGNLLLQRGRSEEAVAHYQAALKIQPRNIDVQNNLAWVLATSPTASLRNGPKALELAQQADKLTGGKQPAIIGTLAAAYAEAGHFSEAVGTAQRGWRLAAAQTNTAQMNSLQLQIEYYQAGSPFRDTNAPQPQNRP